MHQSLQQWRLKVLIRGLTTTEAPTSRCFSITLTLWDTITTSKLSLAAQALKPCCQPTYMLKNSIDRGNQRPSRRKPRRQTALKRKSSTTWSLRPTNDHSLRIASTTTTRRVTRHHVSPTRNIMRSSITTRRKRSCCWTLETYRRSMVQIIKTSNSMSIKTKCSFNSSRPQIQALLKQALANNRNYHSSSCKLCQMVAKRIST